MATFFNCAETGLEAEELDRNLAALTSETPDLDWLTATFTEAIQKSIKNKSVPWWTDCLTITRKRVNALRRRYQRTKNNEELRESRKQQYFEEKKKYQIQIRKEKINSWKEFCNLTPTTNPWTEVYKLATGKLRNKSIKTTLQKPDGTDTINLEETVDLIMDHLITEDREEDSDFHTSTRTVDEAVYNNDDVEFTQEEIKQVIQGFNHNKAPGSDGITADILLRIFTILPKFLVAIYNECLKRGFFPKLWKIAIIIPIIKIGKENSSEPSKYRPISLLNTGGKVLEKLLINRINHHFHKNELMQGNQFGFTPQRNTTDAAMEAKQFIEPELEKRKIVVMASIDVKGAFDAAWWPSYCESGPDSMGHRK
ncbi:hypothetical protein C0J52_04451 [Blattella germanica]|nr:hypothetical protein C0J52_04451 [Blattella germanica]